MFASVRPRPSSLVPFVLNVPSDVCAKFVTHSKIFRPNMRRLAACDKLNAQAQHLKPEGPPSGTLRMCPLGGDCPASGHGLRRVLRAGLGTRAAM